mmetsp:Transcript_16990/g.20750  ORF Transcript_16990/g.20750 Transcript_16990/m.20750 type:complete len:151 (+) Transcript_16990:98-550(+)
MTWHDASHTGFSIFLNKENLVFSMPLICVCTVYAYVKYLPLNLGLSVIGAGIVIYKVSSYLKTRAIEKKEEKIANLDESLLEDLAADEINKEKEDKQKAAKKKVKEQNKVRQRIAAEKKKQINRGTAAKEDDDDNEDISTFVKAKGKKKN